MRLLDLYQFASGSRGRGGFHGVLRGAPGVKDRDLMHAGDSAVRRAAFFGKKFAADVVASVICQRNTGIAALLRAVVDKAVLADVEIARAGAAPPVVRLGLRNIVLEGVDAGEAALLHRFHFVVYGALLRLTAAVDRCRRE